MKSNSLAHQNGSITRIHSPNDYVGPLKIQNYLLCMDANGNYYLEDYHQFTLPPKMYGDDIDYLTNKCVNTFKTLNKNVGILLSGLKGTGKSIQLKHLAINANMPVIIINTAYDGASLLQFFEKLPSSCVILFDEYEKVYNRVESQYTILPLLDGMSTNPHIYAFSINGSVNEFMIGRPGRIRYVKKYSRLDEKIVDSIIDDMLKVKSKTNTIKQFVNLIPELSMDLLTSIITEVNTYPDEEFSRLISIFNIDIRK